MALNLTSTSTDSNTSTWSKKTKQNHMMEFIRAVGDYRKTRTDEAATIINRHIQMLAVAIDITIFDPNTNVVCEFFASIHHLLTIAEPRSSITWSCISVLHTACKNQSAHHKIIHTYQYIPVLAPVLGDNISLEKKIKLLSLLQEISCGVKMPWIIPNLEHLMTTLIRWVRNPQENEQVKMLSLGIIVNLCFRNLPGMYMLSKCVDIKEFSKEVVTLKGIKTEPAACKLAIILDCIHGLVSQTTFVALLNVTFKSVKESLLVRDPIRLRQNIEFYLNVKTEGHDLRQLIVANTPEYAQRIEEIIYMMVQEKKTSAGDCINQHPECISLVFRFLQSIICCKLPNMDELYRIMSKVALNWIQAEAVAPYALAFLKSIVETSLKSSPVTSTFNIGIFDNILASIPILLMYMHRLDGNTKMSIAECTGLSNIMSLLRMLVKCEKTRVKLAPQLLKQMFDKLFNLVIYAHNAHNNTIFNDSHELPLERAKDECNFTPEAFAPYINALCLISVLAKHFREWQEYFDQLLAHKQIHVVIAEGLCSGSKETRAAALEMTGSPNFPHESIAESMFHYNQHKTTPSSNINQTMNTNLMSYSIVSAHSSKLDEVLKVLNEARVGQRINISTCDVMELYEYKLVTMGHAERSAMASVEAASSQCTHLQHQVASLESELSRIRQLFLHAEQMRKESQNNINELRDQLAQFCGEKKLRQQLEEDYCKAQQNIAQKVETIAAMVARQEEITAERDYAMKLIPQLQESLMKVEKVTNQKDDKIRSMQGELSSVMQRLDDTNMALGNTEKELSVRTTELEQAIAKSEERQHLIDQIMKLALHKK